MPLLTTVPWLSMVLHSVGLLCTIPAGLESMARVRSPMRDMATLPCRDVGALAKVLPYKEASSGVEALPGRSGDGTLSPRSFKYERVCSCQNIPSTLAFPSILRLI